MLNTTIYGAGHHKGSVAALAARALRVVAAKPTPQAPVDYTVWTQALIKAVTAAGTGRKGGFHHGRTRRWDHR